MVAGRGPSPAQVNVLIKRLPDTSLTFALMQGGREHAGWGMDRHMQADLYDAISQNTRFTGQWKNKPPEIPMYPRPKQRDRVAGDEFDRPQRRKTSLKDIFNKLSRR